MVGSSRYSRPLISGLDGVICIAFSIVLHILGIRAIPWERSAQVQQSSPLAIEFIRLPENSAAPASATTLAPLREIPLQDPGIVAGDPDIRSAASKPQTASQTAPQTATGEPVPHLSNIPHLPYTVPLPASPHPTEESQLKVSLAEPLFAVPSPSASPNSEEEEAEWDPSETLPNVPVVPRITPVATPATTPKITPPMPESTPEVAIEGEVQVAANPSPLQFQVVVEVQSPDQPSDQFPDQPPAPRDYTPPQPRHQALILTADPLLRSCTVPTLQAIQDSGTPQSFEVAIDAEGKVKGTAPKRTDAALSADYQNWATCLLQDWPFQPAQRQGIPVAGSLEVLVTIELLTIP